VPSPAGSDRAGRPGGDWLLLLGGRSEIGLAVAERLAATDTRRITLAARRADDLATERRRLEQAGAAVDTLEFDADRLESHTDVLDEASARHGRLDSVVLAFGVLGEQTRAEHDPAHAAAIVHTDYLAHVHLLTELARRMREHGSGRLVVFSSVAGVRVRRANYVYGSAKAGLDGFASGLADALHGTGVRLLLMRPGFVIGRMTAGMRPAPFPTTPEQVADATVAALAGDRQEVWVPPILRPVFAGMRLLPRAVWRRLPR
jgi:NAD(P)-dependent dehydrogenase (short-subunit alcohol dehydrogenase family)